MEQAEMKLVSIVLPVYNSEAYLPATLDSILAQTYTAWELLLVNDASSDNSLDICQKYAAADPRIHLVALPSNHGCAFARNTALGLIQGEYVAFVDADDLWACDKLAAQMNFLEECEADITYTAYRMVNARGQLLKVLSVPAVSTFTSLLKENCIIFSTVLLRRELLQDKAFSDSFFHEDYVLLLDLLKQGAACRGLEKVLTDYRVHSRGRSMNKLNAAKYRWKIYHEYLKLGYLRSVYYFVFYAVNGFRKYL